MGIKMTGSIRRTRWRKLERVRKRRGEGREGGREGGRACTWTVGVDDPKAHFATLGFYSLFGLP